MRKFVLLLVLCLAAPAFAQEPAKPVSDPVAEVNRLTEQRNNLIKQGAQKDAEIEKLRQAQANSPEAIAKAVATRVNDFAAVKVMPVVKACKTAGGKALIQSNDKGQLVYTGCLI